MSDFNESRSNVDFAAKNAINNNKSGSAKQFVLWIGALAVGAALGWAGNGTLNEFFDFVATVFTRLFQTLAIPTIALSLVTTLASLGAKKSTGRIFSKAVTYTLLTTFAASIVGLVLFILIAPENLPMEMIGAAAADVPMDKLGSVTYYSHFLSVIPNNMIQPLLAGNVLSVVLISFAVGLGIAFMPKTEGREYLLKTLNGVQELLFTLIRALVWILPVGIVAFSAQLAAQIEAGVIVGSLGKYVAVVLGGNVLQFFVILPLFLVFRGLNPIKVFRQMSPAIAVALFTKSSAATLPVTMASAEDNMKVNKSVSRFVLPICTTINMNGCAAFILVTSLFLMQNAGYELTTGTMIAWVLISVITAVGNAGVPMGCYFLTLSLMASMGAPLGVMGIILPIYTIIDMIETAVNVWSDSVVCAMTNHDLDGKLD